jgi:hypothetical protein
LFVGGDPLPGGNPFREQEVSPASVFGVVIHVQALEFVGIAPPNSLVSAWHLLAR